MFPPNLLPLPLQALQELHWQLSQKNQSFSQCYLTNRLETILKVTDERKVLEGTRSRFLNCRLTESMRQTILRILSQKCTTSDGRRRRTCTY